MTLERYLRDLAEEEKPLRHSGLLNISSLTTEELPEFKAAWLLLSKERKRDILSKLLELSVDNLELDYSAVFRACLRDEDAEVRDKATRGLWECDDRGIIRPLIKLVAEDPSVKVRVTATTCLGKFAEMAQDGKLLDRDADRIREALQSAIGNEGEDQEVRRRAIEAVASFNSPEIEEIIQDAYQNGDREVKQSSIYAMGRSSNSRWLPIVLEEMHHQEAAIRFEAASACGMLGDGSTVPHLIRLIEDEDAEVQLRAVQALGAIGGTTAKRALRQCLNSGDEALEEEAQTALSNMEIDEDPLGFRFET